MKIRKGFVSNSSSSSFMIYGAHIDFSDDMELIKKAVKKSDPGATDEYIEDETFEFIYGMMDKSPYTVERYGYGAVIGVDPSSMELDKTLRQTMDGIKEHITGVFGPLNDKKFGWYEDCSYDG